MARKKQETLVLFPEVAETTKKMTDAQFGALMRAVFAYRFAGEIYDGDDLIVDIVFGIVAGQVDRYREVCEINRNNAKTENPSAKVQPSAAECSEIQRNDPPIPYPIPIPYPSPIPDPYPVPNNGSEAAEPPTPTRLGPPRNLPRAASRQDAVTDKKSLPRARASPAIPVFFRALPG